MSPADRLREFVNERLTAAAEEIFGVFIKTIVEYQEEIDRQRRLLDTAERPELESYSGDLPQPPVCKEEEELLADRQLCNQGWKSSLAQEDTGHQEIKEEQEELCTVQEGEQLELKQETDTFILTPAYEESDRSEQEPQSDDQLLSNKSYESESRDQKGGKHGGSGSMRDAEPEPKGKHHKSKSLRSDMYDPNLSEIHSDAHKGRGSSKRAICEEDFKLKSKLQTHLSTHTGEKPHVCKTCGQHFRYTSILNAHMRIHTGEKPYSCKTCGKDFTRNSALTVHMRTHTGEKPCLCKTCGKRFCSMTAVRRHMSIHTGERPHVCKICGKDFRLDSDLKVHMRTHTGEKPYLCKTCGRRFSVVSALKRHMTIHIGAKPHSGQKSHEKDFRLGSDLKFT